MANNVRGNEVLGEIKFLGIVSRDIVISRTVIRANDFRETDPYPILLSNKAHIIFQIPSKSLSS
jgi:hypothetical protein